MSGDDTDSPAGSLCTGRGRPPTAHDLVEVARFAELLSALGPVRRDADGQRVLSRDERGALRRYLDGDQAEAPPQTTP